MIVGTSRFSIVAPSPFRLDLTVWALRRRQHNTIDAWDGATYRRTLIADGVPVAVAVHQDRSTAPGRSRLAVEVRRRGPEPSATTIDDVARTLNRMLGPEVDLTGFYDLARSDGRLDQLARRFCGVRPPRLPSVFEACVNAIACQQLSLTVGIHLLDRLAADYGPRVAFAAAAPGFPAPERLAAADASDLRRLGFSMTKSRAVIQLAQQVTSGVVDLEGLEHLDDDDAVAALVALPGIGRWSAEYVLLRGLGRLHVLPGDDVGARNSLHRRFGLAQDAGYDDLVALGRKWWPYGGMVYFHLLLDGLNDAGCLTPASSAELLGTTGEVA